MRIDLHAHSSASDGTDAPAEVVRAAQAARLDVIALTDHDTVAGWDAAAAAAVVAGIGLVPGIEVSTRVRGQSVHLLGYLPRPDSPLTREIRRTVESRRSRIARMVELIAADHDLTLAEVQAMVGEGTPGRPHIARALVARGYVADTSAAFATPGQWLHDESPYHVPYRTISLTEGIRLVLESGGVPVLAHPFSASREARQGAVVDEALVEEAAAAGLVGIEAHHREHDPAAVARALALAGRLGLVVTGSSDYHGTNKPNALGERTTAPEALQEILRRGSAGVAVGL